MFNVYSSCGCLRLVQVLFALELIGAPYELVPASARVGPSQRYLTSLTGEQPYGVVGTEKFAALNPHHAIPTLITESGDSIWESHTIVRCVANVVLDSVDVRTRLTSGVGANGGTLH